MSTSAALVVAAHLLPGKKFAATQLLRTHTHLPVLHLPAEFTLADFQREASIGSGSMMTCDGPVGTLRVQLGSHQAYVLFHLTDREVIEAITAWRKAGFVPAYLRAGGNDGVVRFDTPANFGEIPLARGRREPLSAESFAEHSLELIASGFVAMQATSDVSTIPELRQITACLLATRHVKRAADTLERKRIVEGGVSTATMH